MNILLDSNNVAQFIGTDFKITSTCVTFADGSVCNDLKSTNTTVVNTTPPEPPLGGVWKWENNTWLCINQAAVDAYYADKKAVFNDAQKKRRAEAYSAEADPLFFKAQRGEVTTADWEAKVAEIKARFPYQ